MGVKQALQWNPRALYCSLLATFHGLPKGAAKKGAGPQTNPLPSYPREEWNKPSKRLRGPHHLAGVVGIMHVIPLSPSG